MRLTALIPLAAGALALAACVQPAEDGSAPLAPGASATGEKTYGNLPFWDGDVCVEIKPNGKRTIVSKSQCPPKE